MPQPSTMLILISKLMRIAVLTAAVLFAAAAWAQNSTGRIIGNVTDEQGAAIVGAKVTVTNAETNTKWETLSRPRIGQLSLRFAF